jgi:hypothetical protein
LKVGDTFVSKFGTNLRLTISEVKKKELTLIVERKVVDRKTGEITIDKRTRVVPSSRWRFIEAGYVSSRTA